MRSVKARPGPPRRPLAPASRWMAFLVMATLLAATPAGAIQPPSPGAGGWPPDSALIVHPEEIPVPLDHASQQMLRLQHRGAAALLRARPGWRLTVDPRTGSIDRAFGDGMDLADLPAGEQALDFVSRHADLFAAGLRGNGMDLRFSDHASRPLAGSGARVLALDLFKDGLPVLGAGVRLGVRDGRAVLVTTRAAAPVSESSTPRLNEDEALEAVSRYTGVDLEVGHQPSLAFYPVAARGPHTGLRHHLVHVLSVLPPGAEPFEAYVAYVDARDGAVLVFFPEARHAGTCQSDPAAARGRVVGGVRPNRADDVEVIREMPFAVVNVNGTLVTSDINGRFPWSGGTGTSNLPGSFFEAHCDNCNTPSQPSASADGSGTIDFGLGGSSGPVPVIGNGLSTPADRSAFYHLQQTRLLLGKWDNAFFDEIEVFANIGSNCNAFSSGAMLGFYVSGGGCRNTAEIRDVVSHELGHTWDRFDGNDITNGAMSEWKGDLIALAMGGDGCIGESFRFSGGPTTSCTGVRDIDETSAGRTDLPATPAVCPTCATITIGSNPCGNGSHCLGQIAGQASVHLLDNLRTGADDITGIPFGPANPSLSEQQSRWIFERILIGGGPPMQVMNPATAGLSVYDAVTLMDDEDGNLANGTPHAAYYNAAFSHHGLAESPQVTDAPACSALLDPGVSVTADRDAATGLPAARISWTPMGGATTFDVYRNTRVGDAFLPLARDVAAGPLLDTGVRAGGTYRYLVMAVRRTGCAAVSPGANVVTLTFGEPDLRIQTAVATEAPGGSDGDGRIEPGERVRVAVTMREAAGLSGATSVSALVSSADPFAPVVSSAPVSFGAVPAGGTSPGASPFEIFIGPSVPCGGRAHVKLAISGAEGCWLDSFNVAVDGSGSCAPSPSAFVEVVPGSVAVAGGSGDGDGIPDNCETATVSYQIRNAGTAPAASVVSTVDSDHPGVTFSPAPSCSLPSLAPAAVSGCQFSYSLGGASATGVRFDITATSASNPAPSVTTAVVAAEGNPDIFGTQSYSFEGSLQGWTAREFSLSTARASSGLQSAYAGSLTRPNICARLTSPAFRVHPSSPASLSMALWAVIEPFSSMLWWDRANVHVIDLDTGVHTVIAPSSGPAYNAFGTPQGGLCHNAAENGWAGNLGGFFNVSFNLAPFAGRRIRIEINYSTDELENMEGIYVDAVTITNVAPTPVADGQPDACSVPEVSGPGSAVPLQVAREAGDYRFTWQHLGTGYQYNVYAGTMGSYYSHGAFPLSCEGVGSGVNCSAGDCQLLQPGAGLPGGSLYFLVTASAFGQEGTSGFSSAGSERNPAQNTCAP